MTTGDDPYRAPDPVLQLEAQLAQARQDLETTRAELTEALKKKGSAEDAREEAEKELVELRANASPEAREARTFRIAIICVTAIVLSIVWALYKFHLAKLNKPEGACHDVVLADTVVEKICPHSAQKLTIQDGRARCDCPRGAP